MELMLYIMEAQALPVRNVQPEHLIHRKEVHVQPVQQETIVRVVQIRQHVRQEHLEHLLEVNQKAIAQHVRQELIVREEQHLVQVVQADTQVRLEQQLKINATSLYQQENI